MGKAKIKEHLGDGQYLIDLDIDVRYAKSRVEYLYLEIAKYQKKIDESKQKVDELKEAFKEAGVDLQDYLTPLKEASEAAYAEMIQAYEAWLYAVQNEPDAGAVNDAMTALTQASKAFFDAHDTLIEFWTIEPEIYEGPDWPELVQIRADKESLLGAAQSNWEGARGLSIDPARVALASDAMFAAIVGFDDATNTYVAIITEQQSGDITVAKSAMDYYKTAFEDAQSEWIKAVTETTVEGASKTLKAQYEAKVSAFQEAQKAMSATLNDGSMPPGLSEKYQAMQEAEERWLVADEEYRRLLLAQAAPIKEKDYLNSRLRNFVTDISVDGNGALQGGDPIPQLANAWCVDATEDLTEGTEVATIEIPGERDVGVRVRPGYEDRYTYEAQRDGKLQPSWSSSPEATFFNWAVHPGANKWKPNYRLGVIKTIDQTTEKCTVELDPQRNNEKSNGYDWLSTTLDMNNPVTYSVDENGEQQSVMPGPNVEVVNGLVTLKEVPIVYMECNAGAFEVGDHVMVEFKNRDWKTPTVIGFAETPRPCTVGGVLLTATPPGGEEERLQFSTIAKPIPPATESATLPKSRHVTLEGGNIDWTSTDGKTTLTYDGPCGRSIVPEIPLDGLYDVDASGGVLPAERYMVEGYSTHAVSLSYKAFGYNWEVWWIQYRRFSNVIYKGGKPLLEIGIDKCVLGAAIYPATVTENNVKKTVNWLVMATTAQTQDLSIIQFNDLKNGVVQVSIEAVKIDDISHGYSSQIKTLATENFDGINVLPAQKPCFFSGGGKKFSVLIPRVGAERITSPSPGLPSSMRGPAEGRDVYNDVIVRGTITDSEGELTAELQTEEQDVDPYQFVYVDDGPVYDTIRTVGYTKDRAIVSIDYDKDDEVQLIAEYRYALQSRTPTGGIGEFRDNKYSYLDLIHKKGTVETKISEWRGFFEAVTGKPRAISSKGKSPVFIDLRYQSYLFDKTEFIKKTYQSYIPGVGVKIDIERTNTTALVDHDNRELIGSTYSSRMDYAYFHPPQAETTIDAIEVPDIEEIDLPSRSGAVLRVFASASQMATQKLLTESGPLAYYESTHYGYDIDKLKPQFFSIASSPNGNIVARFDIRHSDRFIWHGTIFYERRGQTIVIRSLGGFGNWTARYLEFGTCGNLFLHRGRVFSNYYDINKAWGQHLTKFHTTFDEEGNPEQDFSDADALADGLKPIARL